MPALQSTVDMYDLRMSEAARPLFDAVVTFIAEEVEPTPLARTYTAQRTLRLADVPDEVHWDVVGRAELASWEPNAAEYDPKTAYYAGLDGSSANQVAFTGP